MDELKRPLLITAICIISWAYQGYNFINGLMTFSSLLKLESSASSEIFVSIRATEIISIVAISLSIFTILVFYDLWKMRKWGWRLSFILSIVFSILGVVFFLMGNFYLIIQVMYLAFAFILWKNRKIFRFNYNSSASSLQASQTHLSLIL